MDWLRRWLKTESPAEAMLAKALDELALARRESAATLDRIVAAQYDRPVREARTAAPATPTPLDAETSLDDDAKWLEGIGAKYDS